MDEIFHIQHKFSNKTWTKGEKKEQKRCANIVSHILHCNKVERKKTSRICLNVKQHVSFYSRLPSIRTRYYLTRFIFLPHPSSSFSCGGASLFIYLFLVYHFIDLKCIVARDAVLITMMMMMAFYARNLILVLKSKHYTKKNRERKAV